MIIIRCDSSFSIGIGHVVRCLNFATKMQQIGLRVHFVCTDYPGNCYSRILETRNTLSVLAEGQCDLELIDEHKPSWVILDSYSKSIDWERKIYSKYNLFIIDDLMNREHLCDVILDQTFRSNYEFAYKNLVPEYTKKYLGPLYSLIPEVQNFRHDKKKFRSGVKKVLVFFGGTDPTNETLKFYQKIIDLDVSNTYTIVATSHHFLIEKIKNLKDTGYVKILIDPPDWVSVIDDSDYFLGSTGTVTWERFSRGLPGSVVVTAHNQQQIAEELSKIGALHSFGFYNGQDYSKVILDSEEMYRDPHSLSMLSVKIMKLVNSFPISEIKHIFCSSSRL